MSNDELAGFLAQGLREAECFELDCSRCGIVRMVSVERPEVCPICGISRGQAWKRRCLNLTRRPLPQIARIRRPRFNAPKPSEGFDDIADVYAGGLEARYRLHRPHGHTSA